MKYYVTKSGTRAHCKAGDAGYALWMPVIISLVQIKTSGPVCSRAPSWLKLFSPHQ